LGEDDLKTKKYQTEEPSKDKISGLKRRSTTKMDRSKSKSKDKERGKRSALSSASFDMGIILDKIDKIGDGLLKQKPFLDKLSEKLEFSIRKALRDEQKLAAKQTNPITGMSGMFLDDPDLVERQT
jgi:hypothetical protein